MMIRMEQTFARWPKPAHSMKFTVERRVLVRMLEATAQRAPRRGRPEKMVRLSACGPRVFVEANGKAAATEALVFAEGACLLVHKTILRLLRGYARRRVNITFEADACLFRIDQGNWPIAAFSARVFPPAVFQEFPFTEMKRHRERR
jgi:hypothetical protein